MDQTRVAISCSNLMSRDSHPYHSLLALTFLGLLRRQTDMAGLQRWAKDHWKTLKEPLGFTRKTPPHATMISRGAAKCSLEQLRDAFARWNNGDILL